MTATAFEFLSISERTALTLETLDCAQHALEVGAYGHALRFTACLQEINQLSEGDLASVARRGVETMTAHFACVLEYADALITHMEKLLDERALYKFEDMPLDGRAALIWSTVRCARQMIQIDAYDQVARLITPLDEISQRSSGVMARMSRGMANSLVAHLAGGLRRGEGA